MFDWRFDFELRPNLSSVRFWGGLAIPYLPAIWCTTVAQMLQQIFLTITISYFHPSPDTKVGRNTSGEGNSQQSFWGGIAHFNPEVLLPSPVLNQPRRGRIRTNYHNNGLSVPNHDERIVTERGTSTRKFTKSTKTKRLSRTLCQIVEAISVQFIQQQSKSRNQNLEGSRFNDSSISFLFFQNSTEWKLSLDLPKISCLMRWHVMKLDRNCHLQPDLCVTPTYRAPTSWHFPQRSFNLFIASVCIFPFTTPMITRFIGISRFTRDTRINDSGSWSTIAMSLARSYVAQWTYSWVVHCGYRRASLALSVSKKSWNHLHTIYHYQSVQSTRQNLSQNRRKADSTSDQNKLSNGLMISQSCWHVMWSWHTKLRDASQRHDMWYGKCELR
jgi:hypothetical protein